MFISWLYNREIRVDNLYQPSVTTESLNVEEGEPGVCIGGMWCEKEVTGWPLGALKMKSQVKERGRQVSRNRKVGNRFSLKTTRKE